MLKHSSRATLCGVGAILIWSTAVGFMRGVTEAFGHIGGAAVVYTLGALMLSLRMGIPDLKAVPKRYFLVCGGLFAACEVLFSQFVGLSHNARQVLEVSIVNYLWPSLLVLFSIIIFRRKAHIILYPALLLSFSGVFVSLSDGGLSPAAFLNNVSASPLPYFLSLCGATLWAIYCNLSRKYGARYNMVNVFFALAASVLWLLFFLLGESFSNITPRALIAVLVTAAAFALSYFLWENALHCGNLLLLGILSYFTPIFSTLFSCLWLNVFPPHTFWYGVILVVLGSLLSWAATLGGQASPDDGNA